MSTERHTQPERTPLERRLAARLKSAPIGECLSFEQILALARQGRRAPGYHTLMQHVITCAECRQAVLQARALVRAQRPAWARWLQQLATLRPLVWAPAVGVAVLALVFLLWYGRGTKQQQLAANLPAREMPSVAAAQPEAPRAPADTRRSVAVSPRLAEARPAVPAPQRAFLPPSQRELQQAAKYPSFVGSAVQLFTQVAATLGKRSAPEAAAPPIEFIQPDLQRNLSIPPRTRRFQWKPVAEASSYLFFLKRVGGGIVAQATLNADQNEFTLEAPLPPAQYEVHLVAQLPSRALSLRREFYVLFPELQQRYEWAQQHAEKLPLLSAAVFYEIDRFEDALRCIERAAQKYPNDPLVAQWRRIIQIRISLRVGEYSE
ncbi:MAG: hypothetical protein NZ550_00510 [Fimbriimonadales bacterium]|nr:hypothetical protein [Fimbriimonadales bacterium]